MLLYYRFKNFMSFKEDVEFSMIASRTKVKTRFPNNYIATDCGEDVLKTAVIVGENAGGKSNFVRSLSYLQAFFKETDKAKSYKNMIYTNNYGGFCPKESNTLQSFEIKALIEGSGIYKYSLELDFVGVVRESLEFKRLGTGSYKRVFSVEKQDSILDCADEERNCIEKMDCHIKISYTCCLDIPGVEPQIEETLQKSINQNKSLGLTITKLAMLGNEHAVNFTEWIKNTLCPETNAINYDIYKSMKNEEDDLRVLRDSRYLDIFRMADYSIVDFQLDEEKPFSRTVVVRKKQDGTTFTRELGQDSSGIREFFAWAVQIFKVVYENKVVFADEMDRVLNPVLSDRVISFICGKEHTGQFVFTTHNVLHLDLKNYMKEQIYFITKDTETLESELYSLSDFPEIRYETTKIYEFYMKGILGGTAVE